MPPGYRRGWQNWGVLLNPHQGVAPSVHPRCTAPAAPAAAAAAAATTAPDGSTLSTLPAVLAALAAATAALASASEPAALVAPVLSDD